MFKLISYTGVGFILTMGVLGCLILILILVDEVWKRWIQATRKTVWFFDYMQNCREFKLWLKEKEKQCSSCRHYCKLSHGEEICRNGGTGENGKGFAVNKHDACDKWSKYKEEVE